MMKRILNKLPLLLLILVSVSFLLEFILCFIRSYSELWYTILVFDIVAMIPSVLGFIFKKNALNILSGLLLLALAILMLVFPSYLMIVSFVLGGIVFLGGMFSLIIRFIPKLKDESC